VTDINFYKLTRSSFEKLVPRLLEKILNEGSSVAFLFKEKERLKYFDEFLWVYSADSFLPHSTDNAFNNKLQPLLLALDEKNLNNPDVFITIEGFYPDCLNKYKKIIDIFDGKNKETFNDALVRVENIKNKGYKVNCWKQENTGWEITEFK